jgi:hypothetical protein
MDELLAELDMRGWLMNNCYQITPDLWRVNLRMPTPTGDYFTAWSEGPTFADTIADAMTKLNDAEFFETPSTTASIEPSRSLLDQLNLRPATITSIARRF